MVGGREMRNILKEAVGKIGEINRKYTKPRIKMSLGVRLALLMLRLYLIFLVLILAYKFFTMTVLK
jgi:hypothetical protein